MEEKTQQQGPVQVEGLSLMWSDAVRLLRAWGNGEEPPRTTCGICFNLEGLIYLRWAANSGDPTYMPQDAISNMLALAFEAWPEYSGDSEYPVPGPNGNNPVQEYASRLLWVRNEYGDARRRLCLHVADFIERRIKNQVDTDWE